MLRVQPKAAHNRIDGCEGGVVRLRVTAPPESGKANAAVIRLLADALAVSKSSITIVRGAASKSKVMAVDGITEAEALRRLESGEGAD